MMHQHVKDDIFGHPAGKIADRNADQRHLRQAAIRHQRVDARAQVEDRAQAWKSRKLARARLPDGGVLDLGRIERRVGQQQDPAVFAHVVEPALPAIGRPVFGPAVNEKGERTFVHRIFCLKDSELPATLPVGAFCANISATVSETFAPIRLPAKQEPLRMLYAILCYHDEDFVGSWTKEQDAAVMNKLAVVQDKLARQGRLGPVARLLPTTSATTLRKDDPPIVIDGPYAETKEQLLGFYVVDCKNLDEALDVAAALGAGNPGGAYEIRPVGLFVPGSTAT